MWDGFPKARHGESQGQWWNIKCNTNTDVARNRFLSGLPLQSWYILFFMSFMDSLLGTERFRAFPKLHSRWVTEPKLKGRLPSSHSNLFIKPKYSLVLLPQIFLKENPPWPFRFSQRTVVTQNFKMEIAGWSAKTLSVLYSRADSWYSLGWS